MAYNRAKERCERMAEYIIENSATVRACALVFGVSKSTVHKDITQRLKMVNHHLYEEVQKVLQKNKSERHLRGGEATKQKYKKEKDMLQELASFYHDTIDS